MEKLTENATTNVTLQLQALLASHQLNLEMDQLNAELFDQLSEMFDAFNKGAMSREQIMYTWGNNINDLVESKGLLLSCIRKVEADI